LLQVVAERAGRAVACREQHEHAEGEDPRLMRAARRQIGRPPVAGRLLPCSLYAAIVRCAMRI
jgi:hypothetical protein